MLQRVVYREYQWHASKSSETTSLTFRLHKSEDITLTHGALYVTHNKAVLVVKELDTDLSNLSTAAGAADDLHDNSQLHGGILQNNNKRMVRCMVLAS